MAPQGPTRSKKAHPNAGLRLLSFGPGWKAGRPAVGQAVGQVGVRKCVPSRAGRFWERYIKGSPKASQGLARSHRVSQGLTRSLVSQGLTRSHKASQGLTRSHKASENLTRSHKASQDLTRSHKVSQGPTRSHKVSQSLTRHRKVPHGLTRISLSIERCHA